ncbi:hypothetical protein GCM10025868_45940 [Angustibacter aerolatus]|uniref:Major facilitator superfamily (MFS) profile domain-containing protein n=1 Tax=Angustibacter aerolatus TaxID=1162965 RepID=A0ABQ6JQC5_9ACTN|nr:hypothetical protein GCM10025868_45940 [Angustibacter aerolatus]
MARVDPRWISGTGGVLAAIGMFGFSRLTVESSYAGHLLPFIVVLSFGLGLVFVPMTLTAVHGVAREDSGVGSAVLNTVQQIGGTIGLATLSTVAVTAATSRATEARHQGRRPQQGAGSPPWRRPTATPGRSWSPRPWCSSAA